MGHALGKTSENGSPIIVDRTLSIVGKKAGS